MKYNFLIFIFLFSCHIFAQQKSDSIEIAQLLKEDYKTMVTNDIEKHREYCTENYLLIENGEIWDMEMEAANYRKNANRVIERLDYFDFKYVRIYENTAYVVYNLKSDITENGILKTKNWNESVLFRKKDGKWKIELIHSTPIDLNK